MLKYIKIYIQKKINLILIFSFFYIFFQTKSYSFDLSSITNYGKEYEEYTDPNIVYNDIIKDFIDNNYSEVSLKIEKLKKFQPFFNKIKDLTTLEILSNFLSKEYEKNEKIIDDFLEINEGDEETFYMLYMKSLSLMKIIKNSQTNINIAHDTLKLFRLLQKRIEKNKSTSDKFTAANASQVKNNREIDEKFSIQKQKLERFEEKIKEHIEYISKNIADNNFKVADYYFESGNLISALQRNIYAIENQDKIFSSEDKQTALKNINIIFNKILTK